MMNETNRTTQSISGFSSYFSFLLHPFFIPPKSIHFLVTSSNRFSMSLGNEFFFMVKREKKMLFSFFLQRSARGKTRENYWKGNPKKTDKDLLRRSGSHQYATRVFLTLFSYCFFYFPPKNLGS